MPATGVVCVVRRVLPRVAAAARGRPVWLVNIVARVAKCALCRILEAVASCSCARACASSWQAHRAVRSKHVASRAGALSVLSAMLSTLARSVRTTRSSTLTAGARTMASGKDVRFGASVRAQVCVAPAASHVRGGGGRVLLLRGARARTFFGRVLMCVRLCVAVEGCWGTGIVLSRGGRALRGERSSRWSRWRGADACRRRQARGRRGRHARPQGPQRSDRPVLRCTEDHEGWCVCVHSRSCVSSCASCPRACAAGA